MTDVFLSYSRKDSEFMRYLHEQLSEHKQDVWVDWEDIPATADWWDEIKAAIEAADAFAFIISPDSVRSDICHDEIQHAIDNNKRFIPLLYREISDLDAPSVHSAIRSHNWIVFSDESQYEAGVQKLIDSLSTEPDYVRRHTRLLVRAREWNLHERERSYLLAGSELNEYIEWVEGSVTREPKPTEIQLEYVYTSQNRRNRRNLRIAAGVVAGVIIFILLIATAFVQQQQFEIQNVTLTQSQREQEGTTTQLANALAQVRDDSSTILTQGALQAENANLMSTIVAFENTATQSIITATSNPTETSQAEMVAATEENIVIVTEIIETETEAADNGEPTVEVASTETPYIEMSPTYDAGAQQIVPTNQPEMRQSPEPPDQDNEREEGFLYVGPLGNDNNDCRSPREGSCRTINAALEQAEAGETIEVAPGVYIENLVISQDIIIVGESVTIGGEPNSGQAVIIIEPEVEVELINLKITGGHSDGYGGGILNKGILFLENVHVEANTAQLVGGGIANLGELDGIDVVVKSNYALNHPDIYSSPLAWAELNGMDYDEDNRLPLELPSSTLDEELLPNMLIIVDTGNIDRLNLRQQASTNAPIIRPIENGTIAFILQGPEERDDFFWWEIQLQDGEKGWAVDFVDEIDTFIPIDEFIFAEGEFDDDEDDE